MFFSTVSPFFRNRRSDLISASACVLASGGSCDHLLLPPAVRVSLGVRSPPSTRLVPFALPPLRNLSGHLSSTASRTLDSSSVKGVVGSALRRRSNRRSANSV